MLVQGGQDTTATWAKNMTAAFAEHPDQRRALADNPQFLRQALDEVIRWQTPVANDVRVVRNEGTEIGKVRLAQGDRVIPMIAAAHRDPTRWERAEKFDIARPQLENLGFGFGVHNCMGVNYARTLVTCLATTLLTEIPEYHLDIPIGKVEYGRSYVI
jgi:cytochrome P450